MKDNIITKDEKFKNTWDKKSQGGYSIFYTKRAIESLSLFYEYILISKVSPESFKISFDIPEVMLEEIVNKLITNDRFISKIATNEMMLEKIAKFNEINLKTKPQLSEKTNRYTEQIKKGVNYK